uniref:peptide-methionine (S)-S-oxide reductase n=1 Tax=Lotharella oceanica TaxID=641309 RepID=A0A7S2TL91_9EUKA|mmetsp:Transcript_19339/g.36404  ORF Transcript_19339/g.36404 Transcript_19339/m.36404 type:complete len:101 (+) Transcript_19339:493-795(+)|eukprot:CAMPEP_0170173802 /NCGR_PEP_ID=MMETSP0040_2-20121228/7072_1 /TAXON_ID=641309 /ORGANISM="Lotharella oceanica, Strain CCMP622" /LENGTH=100 /DNA_ID=CAMNT_0010415159 /DNA_START=488 /DNA_END=790 /DNA_ORIENTATION=-
MGDRSEVIQVIYDPAKVSFEDLLEVFFSNHDYSTRRPNKNRSGIWCQDEAQLTSVNKRIESMRNSGKVVVTHVAPLGDFYIGEKTHQNYYDKPMTGKVRR